MEFSGGDFSFDPMDTASEEPETPNKGGRPTIPDNLLLGSRNQWRVFFEQCWPEIGWPLSRIRKRRSSTITDVQSAFRRVVDKPHCDHAKVFLRGEPQRITVRKLRKYTLASSRLRYELQDMQREYPGLQRACAEAANAVKQADKKDKATFRNERRRRRRKLRQHEKTFAAKQRESVSLEDQLRNGEMYLYCSELLSFLRSEGKRKRALTPLNLANALAGLPYMRWRQSETRCSKMSADSFAQHPYVVFRLVERLFLRIGAKRDKSLTDRFREELLSLPKKEAYPRDSICQQWRDFRLAVEEVLKTQDQEGFIPYAITSAYLRNVSRPKTSLDNIRDSREKLSLPRKRARLPKRKGTIGVTAKAGRAGARTPNAPLTTKGE